MKDPFSSDKARFLVLGSRCSVCGRLVCVGPVGTPGDFSISVPQIWEPPDHQVERRWGFLDDLLWDTSTKGRGQ